MKNFKITIETEKAQNNVLTQELNSIMNAASDKHNAVELMKNYFKAEILSGLKIGSGGSHIWISNNQDKRLVIIYLK